MAALGEGRRVIYCMLATPEYGFTSLQYVGRLIKYFISSTERFFLRRYPKGSRGVKAELVQASGPVPQSALRGPVAHLCVACRLRL